MQDLNEHMEHLLRRAAEEYPLETNSSDWWKVAAMLHNAQDGTTLKLHDKKSRDFLLWILLLMPLGWICSHTPLENGKGHNLTPSAATAVKSTGQISRNITEVQENVKPGKEVEKRVILLAVNPGRSPHLGISPIKASNKSVSDAEDSRELPAIEKTPGSGTNIQKVTGDFQPVRDNGSLNTATGQTSLLLDDEVNTDSQVVTDTSAMTADQAAQKKRSMTSDSTVDNLSAVVKPNEVKALRVYAGILAGPGISVVKFQTVHSVGFSAGVIAGYKLSKQLAIESGILWNQKAYYTKGKHFDAKKAGITTYSQIQDIYGTCKMFEIPVNVTYAISHRKKHSVFVSLGSSSYIMKNEEYDYTYTAWGQYYYRERTYKNSTRNWFSVANISVGYQRPFGRVASLRIQPYAQLPVGGVGIGNISLMSYGIHFSLTRGIF